MALFGRNQKVDNRRSSSYCSTVTFVVFVTLCLLGVWVMTSSNVIPAGLPTENKSEIKEEDRSIDTTNNLKQEDPNPKPQGDDSLNENAGSSTNNKQNVTEETTENSIEKTEVENPVRPSDDKKGEADTPWKNQSYDDENGKTEGGELVKKSPEEGGQDKNTEQNPEETSTDSKDKKVQNSDEDANSNNNNNSGTQETQAYDDENGKLEAVELLKEDGKVTNDNGGRPKHQNYSDENGKTGNGGEGKFSDVPEDKDGFKKSEKVSTENTGNEQQQQYDDEKKSQGQEKAAEENGNDSNDKSKGDVSSEAFPGGQAGLLNETSTQNGAWSTQAAESKKEKKVQAASLAQKQDDAYTWQLCNATAGADYIPCLDNEQAIKKLRSTKHYEHRERHCPEQAPTCLVPLPANYKQPIQWPHSREKIWYHNVPHTKLVNIKGHQNWVKVSGEHLTFPGGGTQFKHGALHYIDLIQESLPVIAWGKRSRVVLDVGCGVASFGGYLFDRDVLAMSFAPKDEHEAQVQFALERGIPAISAVMGTKRLPFPSNVFDVIHCARCRVPWHIEGGMLLLEVNRLLRPGGFFVWSATPVYQNLPEDVEIWDAMSELTKSMCWDMLKKAKDSVDRVGLVIFKKPSSNDCYKKRKEKSPPLCEGSDDPNAAWNVSLQACMHKVPVDPAVRGARWPEQWPERLEKSPDWLNSSQVGVYGKPAPEDFEADYEHWKHVVSNSYLDGMGMDWSSVRNVMDMRAVYGGFAAALRDMKVWVMNVVPIDSPDTLPIIYERGLFGMYHDWCQSFSTYPRSYDLLHADHLFSKLKDRCKLLPVIVEVDRILRPEGKLIVRDTAETIREVESIAKSLHWEIRVTFSKQKEGLLCAKKTMWRPKEAEGIAVPIF